MTKFEFLINDGEWHYAVMVYDGSEYHYYIDGLEIEDKK